MSRATVKKYYYYILVLTEHGPVFVTKVEYNPKTCYWDKNGKPYEMGSMDRASDIALGLSINGSIAFPIKLAYEMETQPHMYDKGEFKWIWNKEEDNNDET